MATPKEIQHWPECVEPVGAQRKECGHKARYAILRPNLPNETDSPRLLRPVCATHMGRYLVSCVYAVTPPVTRLMERRRMHNQPA